LQQPKSTQSSWTLMTNPEEPLQLRLCGVAAESARASAIYAKVAQLESAAILALELLSL